MCPPRSPDLESDGERLGNSKCRENCKRNPIEESQDKVKEIIRKVEQEDRHKKEARKESSSIEEVGQHPNRSYIRFF